MLLFGYFKVHLKTQRPFLSALLCLYVLNKLHEPIDNYEITRTKAPGTHFMGYNKFHITD